MVRGSTGIPRGPSRAANGQQTSETASARTSGIAQPRAERPHEQRDPVPFVVHLGILEGTCHAGGRGFESRRSRLSVCPANKRVALPEWVRIALLRAANGQHSVGRPDRTSLQNKHIAGRSIPVHASWSIAMSVQTTRPPAWSCDSGTGRIGFPSSTGSASGRSPGFQVVCAWRCPGSAPDGEALGRGDSRLRARRAITSSWTVHRD
jgi:hypothetical protein